MHWLIEIYLFTVVLFSFGLIAADSQDNGGFYLKRAVALVALSVFWPVFLVGALYTEVRSRL